LDAIHPSAVVLNTLLSRGIDTIKHEISREGDDELCPTDRFGPLAGCGQDVLEAGFMCFLLEGYAVNARTQWWDAHEKDHPRVQPTVCDRAPGQDILHENGIGKWLVIAYGEWIEESSFDGSRARVAEMVLAG